MKIKPTNSFTLMIISFVMMGFTIGLSLFPPLHYELLLVIYGTVFGLATLYFVDHDTNPDDNLLIKLQTDLHVSDDAFLYISTYSHNKELWYSFDFQTNKSYLKQEEAQLERIQSHYNLNLEFIREDCGVRYYKSKV